MALRRRARNRKAKSSNALHGSTDPPADGPEAPRLHQEEGGTPWCVPRLLAPHQRCSSDPLRPPAHRLPSQAKFSARARFRSSARVRATAGRARQRGWLCAARAREQPPRKPRLLPRGWAATGSLPRSLHFSAAVAGRLAFDNGKESKASKDQSKEISRLINERNEAEFARKASQGGGGLSLVRLHTLLRAHAARSPLSVAARLPDSAPAAPHPLPPPCAQIRPPPDAGASKQQTLKKFK